MKQASIRQSSLGLWAQEDVRWTPWLRTIVGLRSDLFGFDVADLLETPGPGGDGTSGIREAGLVSPKASVVLSPTPTVDVFLNAGRGFHSNDARGAVLQRDPVAPLTAGTGAEVGTRFNLGGVLDVAATVWGLDLDSELVWVGDEGTTEARGPTRRLGADLELRYRLTDWLWADADLSVSQASFVRNAGNGDAVALAPLIMSTGGLSARHPTGFFGRLGWRGIGDRPATEDRALTAQGWFLLDLVAGYHGRWFEVQLSAENLLNSEWREAQFASASRLSTEPPIGAAPPQGVCGGAARPEVDCQRA